jgi:hypothetical protein
MTPRAALAAILLSCASPLFAAFMGAPLPDCGTDPDGYDTPGCAPLLGTPFTADYHRAPDPPANPDSTPSTPAPPPPPPPPPPACGCPEAERLRMLEESGLGPGSLPRVPTGGGAPLIRRPRG